jgi:predicted nuclease of predicted toxin-antitoxin system
LTPELVTIARERGHWETTHVTWLGMRSRKDWSIARRAVDSAYVLVTNNTTDFLPLLEREKTHPGLVCLNVAPRSMSLDVQRRLFTLALERLGNAELSNEILEVTLSADGTVLVERYSWRSGG